MKIFSFRYGSLALEEEQSASAQAGQHGAATTDNVPTISQSQQSQFHYFWHQFLQALPPPQHPHHGPLLVVLLLVRLLELLRAMGP